MKKVSVLFLVLTLLISKTVFAAETAVKTSSKVIVDGVEKFFDAYNINDSNYFKLRDIAFVLNGTSKEFGVNWDGNKNAINLTSKTPYTITGGEMILRKGKSPELANLSTSKIYLDDNEINLTAYNIRGNNYFKLRDLGDSLDFKVDWDGNNKTIIIQTFVEDKVESLPDTHRNYIENWANVSPIQQFSYKNEGLAYGFVKDNSIQLVTPKKSFKIDMKYPLLGDIISDNDGNFYIVWGKEGNVNTDETVFISKYSQDGIHLKTIGFVGESIMGADGNTKTPFDAGNCVSAIGNGCLMVNYARLMYNGHQSNNVVGINLSDLTPIKQESVWNIPYTSHSFNQSILWSDKFSDFIYASHGDAYDRGFVVNSKIGEKLLFNFYLESNTNYNMFVVNKTFAQLGGLVETSKGIVLVGSSAKSIGEEAKTEKQNLFVQVFNPNEKEISQSMFVGGTNRTGSTSLDINDNKNSPLTQVTNYGVQWISNYTDENVIAPQALVVDDKIIILWSTENDSFYMQLASNGNVIKPATSLSGIPLNSFERPIYYNGYIYWVYVKDGKVKVTNLKL